MLGLRYYFGYKANSDSRYNSLALASRVMGKDNVIHRLKEITDRSHNTAMIRDMEWLQNTPQHFLDELNSPQLYSDAHILRSLNYTGVSPNKSCLIFIYHTVQYDWLLKALEKYPEDREFIEKYHNERTQTHTQTESESDYVSHNEQDATNINANSDEDVDLSDNSSNDDDSEYVPTSEREDESEDDDTDSEYDEEDEESEDKFDESEDIEDEDNYNDYDENDHDEEDDSEEGESSECSCEGCNPDIRSVVNDQPVITSRIVKAHADVLLDSLTNVLQEKNVSLQELNSTYEIVFDVQKQLYSKELIVREKIKKQKEKIQKQKEAGEKLRKICDALKDIMKHRETFDTLSNDTEKVNVLQDLVSALETCITK